MTTIPQRLRDIAEDADRYDRTVCNAILEIANELESANACERAPYGDLRNAKWLDPECYAAGACQSLRFKASAPAASAAKPLDDARLQELFGCTIDGALTSGYQGVSQAPDGHWLKLWWDKGRAVAEREQALQARINALEARQVPSADKEISDFLAKVRATCAKSLSVPPGTAVDIDPSVVAEMHKFMRDESSMFDRLAMKDVASLAAYIENVAQPDTSKEQP